MSLGASISTYAYCYIQPVAVNGLATTICCVAANHYENQSLRATPWQARNAANWALAVNKRGERLRIGALYG